MPGIPLISAQYQVMLAQNIKNSPLPNRIQDKNPATSAATMMPIRKNFARAAANTVS